MAHTDVRLDFNYALQETVGKEGVAIEEIEALEKAARGVHRGLHAMKEVGQLQFYQLPYQEEVAQTLLKETEALQSRFDTLVVFGIGGSALGAKALLNTLKGPYFNLLSPEKRKNGARLFISDFIDPEAFSTLLEQLDFKKTLFNVISKSGDTLETMTQFKVVRQILKERVGNRWKDHIVVTTDPAKGPLREWVKEEEVKSFQISPGVGGRFSVLSPVGLFPAAMAGIPILDLLAGARRAELRCQLEDPWMNFSSMLASLQYLLHKKRNKNILVMMPYSEHFFPVAEWYAQLWGESIGKRFSLKGQEVFTGSTPLAACGTKDQHSQLQLYMEGPRDKFILFLTQEHFQKKIPIPEEPIAGTHLAHLTEHTMDQVLRAELDATEAALREQGVPTSRILIPHRNAYSVGQLLFLLEVSTAFAGGLYEVNPFDQPGVELGKKFASGLLGKPGFEEYREKVMAKKRDERFII